MLRQDELVIKSSPDLLPTEEEVQDFVRHCHKKDLNLLAASVGWAPEQASLYDGEDPLTHPYYPVMYNTATRILWQVKQDNPSLIPKNYQLTSSVVSSTGASSPNNSSARNYTVTGNVKNNYHQQRGLTVDSSAKEVVVKNFKSTTRKAVDNANNTAAGSVGVNAKKDGTRTSTSSLGTNKRGAITSGGGAADTTPSLGTTTTRTSRTSTKNTSANGNENNAGRTLSSTSPASTSALPSSRASSSSSGAGNDSATTSSRRTNYTSTTQQSTTASSGGGSASGGGGLSRFFPFPRRSNAGASTHSHKDQNSIKTAANKVDVAGVEQKQSRTTSTTTNGTSKNFEGAAAANGTTLTQSQAYNTRGPTFSSQELGTHQQSADANIIISPAPANAGTNLDNSAQPTIDQDEVIFYTEDPINTKKRQQLIEKAEEWLRKALHYREDYRLTQNLFSQTAGTEYVQVFRTFFPIAFTGRAKKGHAVFYVRCGFADFGALQKLDQEIVIRSWLRIYEYSASVQLRKIGEERNAASDRTLIVVDLTNMKSYLSHANYLRKFLASVEAVMKFCYPETVEQILIIHMHWVIRAPLNAFGQLFLHPATFHKIKFLASTKELHNWIEPKYIPAFLGNGALNTSVTLDPLTGRYIGGDDWEFALSRSGIQLVPGSAVGGGEGTTLSGSVIKTPKVGSFSTTTPAAVAATTGTGGAQHAQHQQGGNDYRNGKNGNNYHTHARVSTSRPPTNETEDYYKYLYTTYKKPYDKHAGVVPHLRTSRIIGSSRGGSSGLARPSAAQGASAVVAQEVEVHQNNSHQILNMKPNTTNSPKLPYLTTNGVNSLSSTTVSSHLTQVDRDRSNSTNETFVTALEHPIVPPGAGVMASNGGRGPFADGTSRTTVGGRNFNTRNSTSATSPLDDFLFEMDATGKEIQDKTKEILGLFLEDTTDGDEKESQSGESFEV
ncbi:unnamed protein product [Amoebophrya sp. A120]|nr:unnamed protein product [Amoebophrya sp. A120]|eukprot:GSA120T00016929001.1